MRSDVERASRQILETSLPLYLQALTTFEVLHRLIGHVTMYFCQRRPSELGAFAWIVDGKDPTVVTKWETWWSQYAQGALATMSKRRPAPMLPIGEAAFDAIGGEATALQALDAVAPGGHAVLVGIPAFAVRAPISPFNMVFGEKTISGTYYGSVRPDIDFPILADLDMDKRLNLDDLISRTYKFDEINEGFRLLVSGSVARGVIEFD